MLTILIDNAPMKTGGRNYWRVYWGLGQETAFAKLMTDAGLEFVEEVHVRAPNWHLLVSTAVKTALLKKGAILSDMRGIVKLIRTKRNAVDVEAPYEPLSAPQTPEPPFVEVGGVGAILPPVEPAEALGEPDPDYDNDDAFPEPREDVDDGFDFDSPR